MAHKEDVAGRLAHRLEHARRDGQLPDQLRREWANDAAVRPDDLAHELGLEKLPAVRQRRVSVDQLDRRHDVVALADTRLIDLAGIDRLTKRGLLPDVRRDDAGDLARQVDAGGCAEAEVPGPVREPIDPEHACELEEERIARMGEAELDRDRAPAAMVPIPEPARAEREIGPRGDEGGRRDLVVAQGP